jgi:hypothetical protein
MSTTFWDISPCSPLKINRRFEKHIASTFRVEEFCFYFRTLLGLFIDPEDGGDIFLRNIYWVSADYTALYSRSYFSS